MIFNVPAEIQGQVCNIDIVGPDVCIDTRNVRSATYIPTAFDAAYVSTYSLYNGGGLWTRTDFQEPVVGGLFFSGFRHLTGDWYTVAFPA